MALIKDFYRLMAVPAFSATFGFIFTVPGAFFFFNSPSFLNCILNIVQNPFDIVLLLLSCASMIFGSSILITGLISNIFEIE